jgi:hypothetical protein
VQCSGPCAATPFPLGPIQLGPFPLAARFAAAQPCHAVPFHSHGRYDSHLGRAYDTAQSSRSAALEQFTLYFAKWDGAKWDGTKWDRDTWDRAKREGAKREGAKWDRAAVEQFTVGPFPPHFPLLKCSIPSAAPRRPLACARVRTHTAHTRVRVRARIPRGVVPLPMAAPASTPSSTLPLREYPTRGCAHREYP